jgi:4'-phosphopantetheinyl transferase EntD
MTYYKVSRDSLFSSHSDNTFFLLAATLVSLSVFGFFFGWDVEESFGEENDRGVKNNISKIDSLAFIFRTLFALQDVSSIHTRTLYFCAKKKVYLEPN